MHIYFSRFNVGVAQHLFRLKTILSELVDYRTGAVPEDMKSVLALYPLYSCPVHSTALVFSPAQAVGAMARQGPAFDQATVAKRYNFSFTGEGGGKIFSIIGWFEANDSDASGNIFAGSAEATMAEGAAFTTVSLPLSSSVLSRIRVKELLLESAFPLPSNEGNAGYSYSEYIVFLSGRSEASIFICRTSRKGLNRGNLLRHRSSKPAA